MTTNPSPPIDSYYRVWCARCHTEKTHQREHKALWESSNDGRVARLITEIVSSSPASDVDKEAVLRHVEQDWQSARIMASFASSATCWNGESFPDQLRALREKAEFSREQLADVADLSREAIRLYEAGERRPTWDAVQALAKALGVPTDTFRDLK